ncbi:MAG TPA: GTP cyclohydrolase I, partial [Gemmatimonadaceae bacterium]|nr:GTP cyclohydrolase I [Gemmatimonadaceae bacterium]
MAIGLYKADALDETPDDEESSESESSREFETLVHRELQLLGEDPQREGLIRTPYRVAQAMKFLTQGYSQSAEDVIGSAIFKEEHDNMIMVRDIELYSLCEHHMLPFFGKAHVAYIPNGKIVGLSKI